ncbi:MAG: TRZ/ATZ family hydrolase, partial [Oceanococcaceae bacterium]
GPAADFPGLTVDEHLPNHVLLPGLVNAHMHLPMTLLRGVADDLPLMTWLQEHIWPLEGRLVNAEFCHDGARLGLAESLRGGVTCVNDMYFHPQATAAALDEFGMRGMVGMIVLDFPTPYADGPEAYFSQGRELHDSLRGHARIGTMFAPHAPYTVGDENLIRIRSLADELGVRVHMHVHETAQEVADAEQQNGRRPLRRLADLGLLNENLSAVHMTQLSAAEITAVAEAGTAVIHCPESNLKLASGFCPVAALREAGVSVALGTDGAASNNDLDLFGEMRTAALLAKGVSGRADAIPAAEALEMATLGGARALGLEDQIGSLEPGKQADLIALRLDQPETLPCFDVISQLVYAASRQQVEHAWVGGERRLRDRQIPGFAESRLQELALGWQEQIRHGR